MGIIYGLGAAAVVLLIVLAVFLTFFRRSNTDTSSNRTPVSTGWVFIAGSLSMAPILLVTEWSSMSELRQAATVAVGVGATLLLMTGIAVLIRARSDHPRDAGSSSEHQGGA
jgi:glucose uptake protein GlcU